MRMESTWNKVRYIRRRCLPGTERKMRCNTTIEKLRSAKIDRRKSSVEQETTRVTMRPKLNMTELWSTTYISSSMTLPSTAGHNSVHHQLSLCLNFTRFGMMQRTDRSSQLVPGTSCFDESWFKLQIKFGSAGLWRGFMMDLQYSESIEIAFHSVKHADTCLRARLIYPLPSCQIISGSSWPITPRPEGKEKTSLVNPS